MRPHVARPFDLRTVRIFRLMGQAVADDAVRLDLAEIGQCLRQGLVQSGSRRERGADLVGGLVLKRCAGARSHLRARRHRPIRQSSNPACGARPPVPGAGGGTCVHTWRARSTCVRCEFFASWDRRSRIRPLDYSGSAVSRHGHSWDEHTGGWSSLDERKTAGSGGDHVDQPTDNRDIGRKTVELLSSHGRWIARRPEGQCASRIEAIWA
jgi:hypothetical protein